MPTATQCGMRKLSLILLFAAGAWRAEDSYGTQVASAAVVSLGIGIAGLAVRSTPLMIAGGAGYQLGGPMVHLGHGRSGRALGSFGLRQLLPMGGFLVGATLAP